MVPFSTQIEIAISYGVTVSLKLILDKPISPVNIVNELMWIVPLHEIKFELRTFFPRAAQTVRHAVFSVCLFFISFTNLDPTR